MANSDSSDNATKLKDCPSPAKIDPLDSCSESLSQCSSSNQFMSEVQPGRMRASSWDESDDEISEMLRQLQKKSKHKQGKISSRVYSESENKSEQYYRLENVKEAFLQGHEFDVRETRKTDEKATSTYADSINKKLSPARLRRRKKSSSESSIFAEENLDDWIMNEIRQAAENVIQQKTKEFIKNILQDVKVDRKNNRLISNKESKLAAVESSDSYGLFHGEERIETKTSSESNLYKTDDDHPGESSSESCLNGEGENKDGGFMFSSSTTGLLTLPKISRRVHLRRKVKINPITDNPTVKSLIKHEDSLINDIAEASCQIKQEQVSSRPTERLNEEDSQRRHMLGVESDIVRFLKEREGTQQKKNLQDSEVDTSTPRKPIEKERSLFGMLAGLVEDYKLHSSQRLEDIEEVESRESSRSESRSKASDASGETNSSKDTKPDSAESKPRSKDASFKREKIARTGSNSFRIPLGSESSRSSDFESNRSRRRTDRSNKNAEPLKKDKLTPKTEGEPITDKIILNSIQSIQETGDEDSLTSGMVKAVKTGSYLIMEDLENSENVEPAIRNDVRSFIQHTQLSPLNILTRDSRTAFKLSPIGGKEKKSGEGGKKRRGKFSSASDSGESNANSSQRRLPENGLEMQLLSSDHRKSGNSPKSTVTEKQMSDGCQDDDKSGGDQANSEPESLLTEIKADLKPKSKLDNFLNHRSQEEYLFQSVTDNLFGIGDFEGLKPKGTQETEIAATPHDHGDGGFGCYFEKHDTNLNWKKLLLQINEDRRKKEWREVQRQFFTELQDDRDKKCWITEVKEETELFKEEKNPYLTGFEINFLDVKPERSMFSAKRSRWSMVSRSYDQIEQLQPQSLDASTQFPILNPPECSASRKRKRERLRKSDSDTQNLLSSPAIQQWNTSRNKIDPDYEEIINDTKNSRTQLISPRKTHSLTTQEKHTTNFKIFQAKKSISEKLPLRENRWFASHGKPDELRNKRDPKSTFKTSIRLWKSRKSKNNRTRGCLLLPEDSDRTKIDETTNSSRSTIDAKSDVGCFRFLLTSIVTFFHGSEDKTDETVKKEDLEG